MTTTPKTRVEMIDRVLENLGILVEGQAPTAEMRARVDRVLDGHMAVLNNKEIVYVADLGTANPATGGEFDLELWLAIADSLAFRVAPSFNLAGDPSLKALAIIADDELRVLTRAQRTRRMLRVDPAIRPSRMPGAGNFTRGT